MQQYLVGDETVISDKIGEAKLKSENQNQRIKINNCVYIYLNARGTERLPSA